MPDQNRRDVNPNPPAGGAPPVQQKEGGEQAQEWGQRQEAGKEIARGGTDSGDVPGAQPDR